MDDNFLQNLAFRPKERQTTNGGSSDMDIDDEPKPSIPEQQSSAAVPAQSTGAVSIPVSS